jgi:hypothetical protein
MLDDFSSPFREVREGFKACEDGFGKESVVAKGVDAEDEGCDKSLENVTGYFHGVVDIYTSASVSFSLPPKNGDAFFKSGSISFPMMSTNCFDSFSFSSSSSAFTIASQKDPAFENQVSTKKLMRARVNAPVTVFEAGTR